MKILISQLPKTLCGSFLLLAMIQFSCQEGEDPQPACDGTLVVTVTEVEDTDCLGTTGSITVVGTGGVPPYEYQISGGSFQRSPSFGQLEVGFYRINIKDDNSCTAFVETRILTGLKLENIRPILLTTCSLEGCHDGSRADLPNFNVDSLILRNATQIRTLIGDASMPPPGTGTVLTTSQIVQIGCWVDDGAPQ